MFRSKEIKILATLGPSTLDKDKLMQLEKEGVHLFRINLSHTPLAELESVIRFIQQTVATPICIDSEGAQLRTGMFQNGEKVLKDNEKLRLGTDRKEKGIFYLPLNFNASLQKIEIDDLIYVDFNSVVIRIIEKDNDGGFLGQVISGGKIGSNKGAHIDTRDIPLPPLTEKDKKAIAIARKNNITHFALSFANSVSDIRLMREHVGPKSFLISKIESNGGLKNLSGICADSDAILIDRGDLSRAQPLEKIPFLQKEIIAAAKALKKEVYVATNLLESMTQNKEPTRAEVCDVAGALFDGAHGLVLAAETAIGHHPIACVQMVKRIIHQWKTYKPGFSS